MCVSIPFVFEGRIWDLILLVPDNCLFIDNTTDILFVNNVGAVLDTI